MNTILIDKNNNRYESPENCCAIIDKKNKVLISGFEMTAIPDSVTEIGGWAFENCTSLQSIHIPDSVTEIYHGAFSGCSSLQSIHIPDSVRKIGNSAFSGCCSLNSIVFSKNIKYIGLSAFSGIKNLKSIHLHYDLTDDSNDYSAFVELNEENKECTLYVPADDVSSYRSHPVFGKFKNIEEEPQ